LHIGGAKQLAIQAGERQLQLGRPEGKNGLKWMMNSENPREYPNFSHGTAGVAYFLASLYRSTHERSFLRAAIAGANYLLSIADSEGEYCFIYHDTDNKQLYYLSWCHGPAGTARLFYRLYQVTQDMKWFNWVKRSAQTLIKSGAPERVVVPGEWNNISVCCGVTGQAQFFLSMYQLLRDRQYLNLANKATALLLSKATQDLEGMRWVQAETRVKPDELLAQTGYMQGASGVGMWLLHLHEFAKSSRKPVITLPDNPFLY
jgi:lantibiotic modifying enzyme